MSELTRWEILQSKVEVVGPYDHQISDDGWVAFSRLPLWTWKQFGVSGLHRWTRFPSGVRLRFRSEATEISLEVHVMPLTIARVIEEPRTARGSRALASSLVRPLQNAVTLSLDRHEP